MAEGGGLGDQGFRAEPPPEAIEERGLLIDLGGVLAEDPWPELAERFAPQLSQAEFLAAVYGGNDDTVLIGRTTEDSWWRTIGERLSLHPKALAALRAAADEVSWNEPLLAHLAALPDTRIVLLSNAWPSARRRLNRSGHRALFHDLVISAEVGVAKPDPRIFRLGLDALGLPAQQVLFVDDTRGHVKAARALGIAGHRHTGTADTTAALDRFARAGSGRMAP